jgi:hypothetical protein
MGVRSAVRLGVVGGLGVVALWACENPFPPLAPSAPTRWERDVAHQIYDENGTLREPGDPALSDASTAVRALRDQVADAGGTDAGWDRDRKKSDEAENDVFIRPWFRNAHAFCNDVQRQASVASTRYATMGWIFSTLGLVGTGAFTGLAASSTPSKWDDAAWRGFGVGGVGFFGAVATFGIYWLARSIAADHAASASISGLESDNDNDDQAWTRCLELRATWSTENANATQEAKESIKAQENRMLGLDAGIDAPAADASSIDASASAPADGGKD